MAIISRSDRQLLRNKSSFTLCFIHILFNSNKFHKFWMSFDFRRTHAKRGRIWVKTQADRPILGRPAWHPYTPSHDFDPGAMSGTQMYLSRGLDVGLIVWTERLAQGSKDPQLSAKPCPSQQSTPWSNHKRQDTTSVERRASMNQREAGRPPLGRPTWLCLRSGNASYTDSRSERTVMSPRGG